jgi:hypothetical protein
MPSDSFDADFAGASSSSSLAHDDLMREAADLIRMFPTSTGQRNPYDEDVSLITIHSSNGRVMARVTDTFKLSHPSVMADAVFVGEKYILKSRRKIADGLVRGSKAQQDRIR